MITTSSLSKYPVSEVASLYATGSIPLRVDAAYNLSVENTTSSLYKTSITIPITSIPVNDIKVKTIYDVDFSEL